MKILNLINILQTFPDCSLHPPKGLPNIQPPSLIPDDLREFYEICGGATLFDNSAFRVKIASPQELLLANPIIFVGINLEELRGDDPENLSWSWYIIGYADNGQYITIDLSPQRLGRCYDSFWDRHASPGNCPIIALSFQDLLKGLISSRGKQWYWNDPSFRTLGDAYDNYPP